MAYTKIHGKEKEEEEIQYRLREDFEEGRLLWEGEDLKSKGVATLSPFLSARNIEKESWPRAIEKK